MPGGNVRFYGSGFGPGMAFGGGMHHPNMRARQQQHQNQRQREQQQRQPENFLGQLAQFLPILMIMLLTFFNGFGEEGSGGGAATGGSKYFSLTPAKPHTNPLTTKLTNVKDIPFYVSDQFLRTIARDRYQLSQVERMVENSYRGYLVDECKTQKAYKRRLESLSSTKRGKTTEAERANLAKKADGFELTRCIELEDLFPQSVMPKDRVKRTHGEF